MTFRVFLAFLLTLLPLQVLAQLVQVDYTSPEGAYFRASGVMYSDSICITAGHVVGFKTDQQVKIIFAGKVYEGAIVGVNEGSDVAVVRMIRRFKTTPIKIGVVKKQDRVIMRGLVFGSEAGPTARVVEGKYVHDGLEPLSGELIYLFDGKPVEGMSGGPILNSDGHLVSIVSGYTDDYGIGTNTDAINKLLKEAGEIK